MKKVLQNVLHSYKNRCDYYKTNEREVMKGYISRVKMVYRKVYP